MSEPVPHSIPTSISDNLFRAIVEEAPFGLIILQSGEPVYANPTALLIFSCESFGRLQSMKVVEAFDRETKERLLADITGVPAGVEVFRSMEGQVISAAGRVVDVEVTGRTILWEGGTALIISLRDISQRKHLERDRIEQIREQEALGDIDKLLVGIADLRRLLDTILSQAILLARSNWVGVLLYDRDGRQVEWRGIKGNRRDAGRLEPFDPEPGLKGVIESPEPIIVGTAPGAKGDLDRSPGLVGEGLLTSGWFPLRDDQGPLGALVVGFRSMHDFTDKEMALMNMLAEKTSIAVSSAALYEELREHERELERLSGARVHAQEEERRRIAREIHDGVGQILTAIKFNVEILEDSTTLSHDERKRLEDVRGLLDSVMREAREISYNLMPSVLDDFGLAPALQLFCERMSSRTGVKIEFYGQGMQERLLPQLEIALYRIVQEALNNALRHGEATDVHVQVFRVEGKIRLTIEDNGKGMATTAMRVWREDGGGIGLLSMRERVNSFTGTMTVDSAPGKGTIIAVEVPVASTKKVADARTS